MSVPRGRAPAGARRARRGAAMIEFALLLPVFIAILGITVDLGWFFWRHSIVLDAAREAARVGADTVDSSTGRGPASESDIENAAIRQGRAVLAAHGLACSGSCAVQADWETDRASGYELLTVHVEYPFHPILGMWPGMTGPVVAEFTVFTAVQT